jgi:LmbE family N-acetylglucosaminyl deacetylase
MLVKHAAYQSGLSRIEVAHSGRKLAPWRPAKMFYYPMMDDVIPALLVDISPVFEQKLAAIRAYETQFGSRPGDGPQTFINSPGFLDALTARWRKQGFAIGKDYAEGLIPIDAFEAPPGSLVS